MVSGLTHHTAQVWRERPPCAGTIDTMATDRCVDSLVTFDKNILKCLNTSACVAKTNSLPLQHSSQQLTGHRACS